MIDMDNNYQGFASKPSPAREKAMKRQSENSSEVEDDRNKHWTHVTADEYRSLGFKYAVFDRRSKGDGHHVGINTLDEMYLFLNKAYGTTEYTDDKCRIVLSPSEDGFRIMKYPVDGAFWVIGKIIALDNKQPDVVSIKLLSPDAKVPTRNLPGDAGMDLYSLEDIVIKPGQRLTVKTGISIAIPKGYAGLIWPRSGLAVKNGLDVLAGVIDSSYRGDLMVCLLNTSELIYYGGTESSTNTITLPAGSKIAQLLIQPIITPQLVVVDELEETERGSKGFGSSG